MLYMVIESFLPGKEKLIYQRLEEKGRLMPDGVRYINSWVERDLSKCYQVMECDSEENLLAWMRNWDDLMKFEIIPVLTSEEAKQKVMAS